MTFFIVCADEGPEGATAELLLNDRQHLIGQLFEDFLIDPQHRSLRHRLSPSLTTNFIRGSSPVGTDGGKRADARDAGERVSLGKRTEADGHDGDFSALVARAVKLSAFAQNCPRRRDSFFLGALFDCQRTAHDMKDVRRVGVSVWFDLGPWTQRDCFQ